MSETDAARNPARYEAAALAFAVVFPTLVTLPYFVFLATFPSAVQGSAYTVGKVMQFAFPLVWVLLVRRERLRFERPPLAGILAGLGFGLAVVLAMLGLYYPWLKPAGFFVEPAKAVHQKVTELGLDSPALYAATALFYALFHSFLEEYYWRWFVFGRLAKIAPLWAAVGISSLGFMIHHVLLLAVYFTWASPATYLFSFAVALGGAIWALLYHWTRSLSAPWLGHLLVDAGIFFIGYDLLRDQL